MLLITALQVASYAPRLPEKLATHFDAAGRANGWMSKEGFFVFHVALLGLFGAVFGLLPRWLGRIPNSLINLPHKNYWLAPERRAASLADVADAMAFLGALTLVFLAIIGELTLRANLLPEPRLGGEIWWLLGGYGVVLVLWIIRLLRRFPRPPVA
ncbi:hypothetical protein LBMAG56_12680 [Verrucomicrobiota bacterium]|nr:hypothetical protein LBMAG56_12680 [Verrucomicrobiota bacterium]